MRERALVVRPNGNLVDMGYMSSETCCYVIQFTNAFA
jgi:hypothetical protein